MVDARRPIAVIAHRGASALRPEHTRAAYLRAIADGADLIEPDLVMSRDGALIARHENEIGSTTDVAAHPEFAARRRTSVVDGQTISGWFTEDFTLAELKTLRARERLPQLRSTRFDGREPLLTMEEIIELVARASRDRGRPIGVIPEIKHPTHFRSLGLGMEEPLVHLLAAHPHTRRAPVEIQSFEIDNLRALRPMLDDALPHATLLQLLGAPHEMPFDSVAADRPLTCGQMMLADGLRNIARYADAIGPPLTAIIPRDADGGQMRPTTLVADAHAAGLQVHPYTFRPENHFLPADFRGPGGPGVRHEAGSIAEMRAHLVLGIDALFTDDPALGRAAVDGA